MYNTVRQVVDFNLNIKLKIFYFTLEMSKEEKMLSAFSNILYVKEGIRVSPKDLKSTMKSKILSADIIDVIKKYQPYFEKIQEIVEFIDNIRNPTGEPLIKKIYKIVTKKLGFVKYISYLCIILI